MKCAVGIGANVGDRRATLERAAAALALVPGVAGLRASPLYQTPALTPPGAPDSWRRPFLNAVVELRYSGHPRDLLFALKKIERALGREPAPRWAPRVIDLDLLHAEGFTASEPKCRVPHPEIEKRAFVLDPWKHLSGERLAASRRLRARAPLWMAICNVTPDSFSDGGELAREGALLAYFEKLERAEVAAYDFGAESTRPGAAPVGEAEEWERLAPALAVFRERYRGKFFRPLVSVDTHRAATAVRALEAGAQVINDVSGLADPAMIEALRSSDCHYVLTHSLGVPARRDRALDPSVDPLPELLRWAGEKLEWLHRRGVPSERVWFDPGIGFGKSPEQNLAILRRASELFALPTRILIGHSRKSCLASWGPQPPAERDGYGIGISLHLADLGVEALRVHSAHLHATAFFAHRELHANA